jgi:hypothetical protein
MRPDLKSRPEDVFTYAMEGDVTDNKRFNYQEALAILQFQVLIQQQKTARAQWLAAVGTFLLFAATIGLIVATAA